MHSRFSIPPKNIYQSGQALVIGAAFAFVLAVFAFMLYANSRNVLERTELVNTADAAAYSAGVAVSRELNFLALSNRAIIANHVTVGHLVSYKSWTNNVADLGGQVGENVEKFGALIGILAELANSTYGADIGNNIETAGRIFKYGSQFYDDAIGLTTSLHIALQQQLIASQRAAQELAVGQLSGAGNKGNYYIDDLMKQVALQQNNGMSNGTYMDSYADYLVNNDNVIDNLAASSSSGDEQDPLMDVYQHVPNQYKVFSDLLNKVSVLEDKGTMQNLVEKSYTSIDSSDWFTDRGWSVWWGMLSKDGLTTQQVVNGKLDWVADDNYELKLLGWTLASTSGAAQASDLCNNIGDYFSAPFGTLGEAYGMDLSLIEDGISNAVETTCSYEGIPDYYQLSDAFVGADGGNGNGEIGLAAVLSKTMSHMSQDGGNGGAYLDDLSEVAPTSAVAISGVKIVHERPPCDSKSGSSCSVGFSESSNTEYANLFNPFWQAKLADPTTLF